MDGLKQPLQLVTDVEVRERLQTYIAAAQPHVERAAFDILSQIVGAFNEANGDQRASLEYAGGGLRLHFDEVQDEAPEASFGDGDLERVTLRLPKELKASIDEAARRHGMSANNWYVRALSLVASRQMRGFTAQDGHGGWPGRGRRGGFRGRAGEFGNLHGRHGGFGDYPGDAAD